MRKLTEDEIQKYIKPANKGTGVDAITRECLEQVDKDKLTKYIRDGKFLVDESGIKRYYYDNFTPRSGSIYFKPSFAGTQILIGIVGDELVFSDGRWFSGSL